MYNAYHDFQWQYCSHPREHAVIFIELQIELYSDFQWQYCSYHRIYYLLKNTRRVQYLIPAGNLEEGTCSHLPKNIKGENVAKWRFGRDFDVTTTGSTTRGATARSHIRTHHRLDRSHYARRRTQQVNEARYAARYFLTLHLVSEDYGARCYLVLMLDAVLLRFGHL